MTPAVRNGRTDRPAERRQVAIVATTFVVGTCALTGLLRLDSEGLRFLGAAGAVAMVWLVGAVLAVRVPLLGTRGPAPTAALGAGVGLVAAGACLAVGFVAAGIPSLREPARDLLAHTAAGTVPVVAVTLINGVAEEVFFRGALYDVVPRRYALPVTTGVYALTTVGSGVLLLPAAALLLGVVTAWLRQRSEGVLAPAAAHVTWSLVMILLLPHVLATGR